MKRLLSKTLGLVLGLAMSLSGLLASSTQAATLLTAETVAVNIARMTPLNPQPGGTLRMSGTLRNRGDETITALQVRLLLSPGTLDYRSEIGDIVAGSAVRDGAPTLAVSEPVASLPSRGEVSWTLESPIDQLPLPAPGVYVAGIEVIGTGVDGLTQRYGLTRTFFAWYPEGSVGPTRVAWLWPVSAAPDRALDGVELTEQAAAEMAPGGRLSRIISSAGESDITWVFDPSVLQTAEEMVAGYEVSSGGPQEPDAAGAGGPTAGEWLADVREAASIQTSLATSYALPDSVALQRSGLPAVTVAATRQAAPLAAQLTRSRVEQTLAWPAGGRSTPAVQRSYERAGASAVLLADTAFPPSPELTYTPDGFTTWAGMPVTLADTGLTAALAMPQDKATDSLLARQRFLAEIAMTSEELPGVQRSIVAAPDPWWNPRAPFLRQTLRALAVVPYAILVPWQQAAVQTTQVARVRQPYDAEQRAAELPKDYLAALQPQKRHARRLSAILNDPSVLGYDQALVRQTSAAWRTNIGAGTDLQSLVSEQLTSRIAKVRVASAGTFTLPGDAGRIPVTVANDLEQDVTVGIRLETDEPARLAANEIPAFVVPAGRKVSVEVESQVVGSGSLPVRIQLTTAQGRRYGEPVTIQVRTTAYSQAAAYVVSGAFVILAFLLGMNFVRRSRARREQS